MGLPISFEEFKKNPMKAIMYLFMLVIVALFGYLMVSMKQNQSVIKDQLKECKDASYFQGVQLDILRDKLHKSDSALYKLESKVETLQQLGKIQ